MGKRIFTSFAVEDSYARDFLVGQSKNEKSPFEFVDMSVKQPWDDTWKTRCRTKIRGCDGVIALLSKNTAKADGALWEMRCAKEEAKPFLVVHVSKDDKAPVPAELSGCKVIEWTWSGIAAFIDAL